jgi:hypothetical protein
MSIRLLATLSLLTILSGCVSSSLDSSYSLQGKGESVIVIGFNQPHLKITVAKGRATGDKFMRNQTGIATYYGSGENGYVVFRAKPNQLLALTSVRYSKKPMLSPNVWPCGDNETISFEVPENKVLYLADLEINDPSDAFGVVSINSYFEGAKKHLNSSYPNLASKLELGTYKMIKSAESCTRSPTVPILL